VSATVASVRARTQPLQAGKHGAGGFGTLLAAVGRGVPCCRSKKPDRSDQNWVLGSSISRPARGAVRRRVARGCGRGPAGKRPGERTGSMRRCRVAPARAGRSERIVFVLERPGSPLSEGLRERFLARTR